MSISKSVNDVFTKLDKWYSFPKYQLERRADIYFALFLPDIMRKVCGDIVIDEKWIIPEFPLKRKNKNNYNYTRNIDYAVFVNDTFYFVELKTSVESHKNHIKRVEFLKDVIEEAELFAKSEGTGNAPLALIAYVRTRNKQKYIALNSHLDSINEQLSQLSKIKIIYIQPFKPKTGSMKIDGIEYVSFADVVKSIKDTGQLAKRFRKSLLRWIITAYKTMRKHAVSKYQIPLLCKQIYRLK